MRRKLRRALPCEAAGRRRQSFTIAVSQCVARSHSRICSLGEISLHFLDLFNSPRQDSSLMESCCVVLRLSFHAPPCIFIAFI